MLYQLSYVRVRVILLRDSHFDPCAENLSRRNAACGPPATEEVSHAHDFEPRHGEDGQTMAEYAVVLAVITPAIVAAFAVLSDAVGDRVEHVIAFFVATQKERGTAAAELPLRPTILTRPGRREAAPGRFACPRAGIIRPTRGEGGRSWTCES